MGIFSKKKTAPIVTDSHDDYAYGNNIAAYNTGSRPWFTFIAATQMPTAGAMAYGNASCRLVPRGLIGPAIGQAIQFRVLNNVFPLRQNTGYAALTGLGGVAHGQSLLQPLIDPYNGGP